MAIWHVHLGLERLLCSVGIFSGGTSKYKKSERYEKLGYSHSDLRPYRGRGRLRQSERVDAARDGASAHRRGGHLDRSIFKAWELREVIQHSGCAKIGVAGHVVSQAVTERHRVHAGSHKDAAVLGHVARQREIIDGLYAVGVGRRR